MKRIKKIVALATITTQLLGTSSYAMANTLDVVNKEVNKVESSDETKEYAGFKYKIIDKSEEEEENIIKIIGYTGNLNVVEIPEKIDGLKVKILDFNFSNDKDNLERVTIKANVKKIPNNMFSECSNLKEVILPDTIEIIDKYAFYGCNNITTFKFPKQLNKIGDNSFCNCVNLSKIDVNENIETIGSFAFSNTKINNNVGFPKSLSSIELSTFADTNTPYCYYMGLKLKKIDGSMAVNTVGYKNVDNMEIVGVYGDVSEIDLSEKNV